MRSAAVIGTDLVICRVPFSVPFARRYSLDIHATCEPPAA